MLIKPDFSEIAEEITPGEYRVRITNATDGTYKTGTQYIKWTMETFGETDPKNEGRKIFYNTPIAGKGAFMIKRLWDAATGGAAMGETFDTTQLFGKELSVVLTLNENGYTEVKAVKAIQ